MNNEEDLIAMFAVDQTKEHNPPETVGDCHAACIASILEVGIEAVPAITPQDLENTVGWWERLALYLGSNGWFLLKIVVGESTWWSTEMLSGKESFIIQCRPSPRGGKDLHCVVCKGVKLVHDPHPSRDGLVSVDSVEYLIPFNHYPVAPRTISRGCRSDR